MENKLIYFVDSDKQYVLDNLKCKIMHKIEFAYRNKDEPRFQDYIKEKCNIEVLYKLMTEFCKLGEDKDLVIGKINLPVIIKE